MSNEEKVAAAEAQRGKATPSPRMRRGARREAEVGFLYIPLPIAGRPLMKDATDKQIRQGAEGSKVTLTLRALKKLTPEKIEALIVEKETQLREQRDKARRI